VKLAVAGSILLLGCAADPRVPAASSPTASRCSALEGKTFASLSDGECGLGPDGVVLCTWHVKFEPNDAASTHFVWQHSDYGIEGDVSCEDAAIIEVATGTARGTYDAATGQLVWDLTTYAAE
jgi:hypothetical protein